MTKNFYVKAAIILVAPLVLSGCATIVSKSTYPVSITTVPSESTVSITDKKGKEVFRGQSPCTVPLKAGAGYFSKAEYQVKISSPGYADQVVPVIYKLNGWYFGNLLIGGLLGMLIVDPATGAMWKLESPPIYVKLTPTVATKETSLQIMDIRNVPEDLKKQLVRIR